ncbi:MAG: YfhO family protein [Planctomycetota bacterium]|jgi:hypothetical protein
MKRFTPVAVLAVFALAMLHPLVFGGEIFFFRDFGRYYLPVKEVCLDRMLAGEFPLWLPELNCGTPVHGELVHALLYPGNVLLLPRGPLGWGLYFAAHLVLGGLGAFALARRLGAKDTGALLTGLAFAGSGYLVSQLHHVPYATTAAWSPLILLLGLRAGDGVRSALPLLGLALTMAALAGEPFTLLQTILLLVVLVLAGLSRSRIRALLSLGAAGVGALLLASPTLLPALIQLGESVRAEGLDPDEAGFGSVHPVRLLTLLCPEAFGRQQFSIEWKVSLLGLRMEMVPAVLVGIHLGAVVLVAALAAPVRRLRAARVLAVVAIAATVLAFGTHVGASTLLSRTVPGLENFRFPDKYWLLVTLAAVLLAGLSLEGLRRRGAIPALVLSGLALAAGVLLGSPGKGLLGATPFLLVAGVVGLRPTWFRAALVTILCAELLVYGVRLNATVPPGEFYHPKGIAKLLRPLEPGRIYSYFRHTDERADKEVRELLILLNNALESCGGLVHGFSYSHGYDPVEPIDRITVYFGTPKDTPGVTQTQLYHRLLRLVWTTHSVTNINLVGDAALEPVIGGPEGIRAYAYREPAFRARLYGDTVPVPDAKEGAKRAQDLDFDAFNILPLEGVESAESNGVPQGSVLIVTDEPHLVRLEVRSDRRAWLFLADAWSSGWKATVNGREEEIRPALAAFRAVPVPPGESVVEFRYRPGWLSVVPFTAGAGLLLILLLSIPAYRARRRKESAI